MSSMKTKLDSSPIPYSFIPSESEQDNPNKLFLGGVAPETTEKQLEEFFSQFGKVKDVRIVTDRVTAACKGYGFVTFNDEENVDHLVERKTIRMNGTKLRIRKAIRRNASQFEHLSAAKKWVMMPNGVLNNQLPPSIMTPPNTPPNINALSLHNLDQSVLPRFKRTLDYESVPVLITSNPRQRTQSSPPPSLPHMFIQEPTVADSFPLFLGNQNPHQLHQHQQQQNHPLPCGAYPPPQQYHYRRRRSSSEPITPEELQHLQEMYHSKPLVAPLPTQMSPQPPPAGPHQPPPLLLQTASPTKLFTPTMAMNPQSQYFFPCYQIPENVLYIQQPVAPLPPNLPTSFQPMGPANCVPY